MGREGPLDLPPRGRAHEASVPGGQAGMYVQIHACVYVQKRVPVIPHLHTYTPLIHTPPTLPLTHINTLGRLGSGPLPARRGARFGQRRALELGGGAVHGDLCGPVMDGGDVFLVRVS